MVPTARMAARIISDVRQPVACTSQPASGMKMVLAKPAINVMTVSARTRWRSNQREAVANAGSYSVADMVRPIPAQIRYSCWRVATRAQATTSSVAAIEPTVISNRGPWRSSQRPTGMAARPARSNASEKAPVISPRDQRSSASMGAR